MKHFFPIFFLLLNANFVNAQPRSSSGDSIRTTTHSVYLEIGGSGGYGSLNYEQFIFLKKKIKLAGRIGISTYHFKDFQNKFNPDILVPITFKTLYGNTHHAEIGIGETFASIVSAGETNFEPKRSVNLHTHFLIGYRYQRTKGGIIAGVAYTPILEFNHYWRNWASISIGYSF